MYNVNDCYDILPPNMNDYENYKTYPSLINFPSVGRDTTIYFANDVKRYYRWDIDSLNYVSVGSATSARIDDLENRVEVLEEEGGYSAGTGLLFDSTNKVFSTVQDIATTASPVFNSVTLGWDPTDNYHATTKRYVDRKTQSQGGYLYARTLSSSSTPSDATWCKVTNLLTVSGTLQITKSATDSFINSNYQDYLGSGSTVPSANGVYVIYVYIGSNDTSANYVCVTAVCTGNVPYTSPWNGNVATFTTVYNAALSTYSGSFTSGTAVMIKIMHPTTVIAGSNIQMINNTVATVTTPSFTQVTATNAPTAANHLTTKDYVDTATNKAKMYVSGSASIAYTTNTSDPNLTSKFTIGPLPPALSSITVMTFGRYGFSDVGDQGSYAYTERMSTLYGTTNLDIVINDINGNKAVIHGTQSQSLMPSYWAVSSLTLDTAQSTLVSLVDGATYWISFVPRLTSGTNITVSSSNVISTVTTPSFTQVTIASDPVNTTDVTTKSYVDALLPNFKVITTIPVYMCTTTEKIALVRGSDSVAFMWNVMQMRVAVNRWLVEGYIPQAYNLRISQILTFTSSSTASVFIQVPVLPYSIVVNLAPTHTGRTMSFSTNGSTPTGGTDMAVTSLTSTSADGTCVGIFPYYWSNVAVTVADVTGKAVFVNGVTFRVWTSTPFIA
jgi:vacuolar-type H+-ATPase subunit D/Vma8